MLNFISIEVSGSVFETVAYGFIILLPGVLGILNTSDNDLLERKVISLVTLALFDHYIFVVYWSGEYSLSVALITLLETTWWKESQYFFIIAFDAQATIVWLFFSSISTWWLFMEWVREHYSTGWNPFYDTKGFAILFMFFQMVLTALSIATCTYYVP